MAKRASKSRVFKSSGALKRPAAVRLSEDVARRVRDGHPWVFEEALKGRRVSAKPGDLVDVLDPDGEFVARGVTDSSALALRVFSRERNTRLDRDWIQSVVRRAAALRRHAAVDCDATSCLRVLNGDSEGLPAVNVDRYAGYLVVCCYSAIAEAWLDDLKIALERVWHPTGIYLQRRFQSAPADRGRPGAELISGESAPPEVVVREGRMRFVVDVTAPLGTGLFADMRLGRQTVAELSAGRAVLNCFSYTGAFSAVAALHGASAVVSVDSAARAHTRARRNFTENGLDADDPAYSFVTGDAFATMSRLASRGRRFDLIVVDPPTFSTAKGRTFTALKDYAELAECALSALAPRGVLCAASNAAKLDPDDFERALGRGAQRASRSIVITQRLGQPPDYPVVAGFPEGAYLKFVTCHAD